MGIDPGDARAFTVSIHWHTPMADQANNAHRRKEVTTVPPLPPYRVDVKNMTSIATLCICHAHSSYYVLSAAGGSRAYCMRGRPMLRLGSRHFFHEEVPRKHMESNVFRRLHNKPAITSTPLCILKDRLRTSGAYVLSSASST